MLMQEMDRQNSTANAKSFKKSWSVQFDAKRDDRYMESLENTRLLKLNELREAIQSSNGQAVNKVFAE